MKKLFLCSAFLLSCLCVFSQTEIKVTDAAKHIGDSVTIHDKLYGYKEFDDGMVLLNVGGAFPNHLLTITIPAKVRAAFIKKIDPFLKYDNVDVIVKGKLIEYKGKPEIVIKDPKELELLMMVTYH